MLLLPIIPFLSAVGMVVSACSAAWYHGLKNEQKEQADRTAAELAKKLYGKCVGDAAPGELKNAEQRLLQ
jgi:hypothetical protein